MNLTNFRLYISQFNWLIVIFTLLVFSGLIKLGIWQTARAIEKEQRIERITNYQSSASLSLKALLELQGNDEDINDIPVKIKGEFDGEKVFLIDNQTHKGRLGYRVLQILTLEKASVLINLGWIEGFIDRSKLPKVASVSGIHEISGNVRLVEKGIVLSEQIFEHPQWPLRVQTIDIEQFSQLISQKLLPFVVYLDTKEPIGFEKNWRPIVMPPEKHTGYAVQWLTLAIAWLSLMIWASYKTYQSKD